MRTNPFASKNLAVAAACSALILGPGALSSSAYTITFNDLPDTDTVIPVGYAGFDWTNLNSISHLTDPNGPGFFTADVAPFTGAYPYSFGYTPVGGTASIQSSDGSTFSLNSAYFTPIFSDPGLSIPFTVEGYVNGVPTYTSNFNGDSQAATLETFTGWNNLSSVSFTDDVTGNFGIDNLDVTPATVPEPSGTTIYLLAGGMVVGLMAAARRKLTMKQ